ncbi:uncharacterized protein LOC129990107 isoform X2 [Argiope bruennichi]|nr:uncharacterized protein LOC129990107 isoform X2 [Argiope bruennichi]
MLFEANKTFCQEEDVQLLYSMALIRFVNLTLEHHQKANNKISMSVLAAKNNIPEWVLDLRHEAVHSYCPSRSILRNGTEFALRYLENTFWSKVSKTAKPLINPPFKREEEVVILINRYKNVQFQKFEDKNFKRSLGKELKVVLRKISALIFHDREKFIDILVRPGNFTSAEDIMKLSSDKSVMAFVNADDALYVPLKLQTFWLQLLITIYNKELMPMFVVKLLLAHGKCRIKLCQKVAFAWALHIFLGKSTESILFRRLRKQVVYVDVPSLVYACVKSATPYSGDLLRMIATYTGNSEKYKKLFFILSLYQGHYISKENSSVKRKIDIDKDFFFTVEHAEEELNELRAKKMKDETDESIWFPQPVSSESSISFIGAVINPVITGINADKQSSDDTLKEQIKIEPSADDNFIIINKNDGEETTGEDTHDKKAGSETTRPENFDMVYRRRPD